MPRARWFRHKIQIRKYDRSNTYSGCTYMLALLCLNTCDVFIYTFMYLGDGSIEMTRYKKRYTDSIDVYSIVYLVLIS